eukprot:CAMPEP_0182547758 /NCGR_PEP_ID=MMETSP1323-20130603/37900_1 /TAXON_ID=236787 /ORGANISM="Florenciella parvula, Strain RCC1693" /LENGTH=178 /DNA_ID=CAMNT_0024759095 /DNA_START=138 /DNA_END=671 /DNA_ORIENTATION=+
MGRRGQLAMAAPELPASSTHVANQLVAPYLDRPVLGASGHLVAVRAPVERVDLVGVARKCVKGRLGLLEVPDLRRAILAGADQQAAVSRPRDLVDGADVAGEGSDEGASASVPHLDLLVEGGAREVAAIRRESNVVDRLLVAGQPGNRLLALGRAPNHEREVVRARNQPLHFGARAPA